MQHISEDSKNQANGIAKLDTSAFRRIGFMIALIAFVMDQSSKIFVMKLLNLHSGTITLTPFLNFISTWNRGVSFSLFASSDDVNRWILVLLTAGLCFIVGYLLYHALDYAHTLGYGCIFGGALGNLADRIYFGAVFDFIDLHLYNWHFYTFNGADKFITLGVFIILGDYVYTIYKQNHVKEP